MLSCDTVCVHDTFLVAMELPNTMRASDKRIETVLALYVSHQLPSAIALCAAGLQALDVDGAHASRCMGKHCACYQWISLFVQISIEHDLKEYGENGEDDYELVDEGAPQHTSRPTSNTIITSTTTITSTTSASTINDTAPSQYQDLQQKPLDAADLVAFLTAWYNGLENVPASIVSLTVLGLHKALRHRDRGKLMLDAWTKAHDWTRRNLTPEEHSDLDTLVCSYVDACLVPFHLYGEAVVVLDRMEVVLPSATITRLRKTVHDSASDLQHAPQPQSDGYGRSEFEEDGDNERDAVAHHDHFSASSAKATVRRWWRRLRVYVARMQHSARLHPSVSVGVVFVVFMLVMLRVKLRGAHR